MDGPGKCDLLHHRLNDHLVSRIDTKPRVTEKAPLVQAASQLQQYTGLDLPRCNCITDCCTNLRGRIQSVIRKIFPYGYKTEFKGLLQIAWPITLTSIAQSLLILISVIFCGHLNKDAFDGVSLALTIINVTGVSVMLGLSTAFDTLLSQTFGSANKQVIGLIIQRGTFDTAKIFVDNQGVNAYLLFYGILIMFLAFLPIFAICINTEHILILIGQQAEVSRLAGQYATVATIGCIGNILSTVSQKYLQTQSILFPSLIILLVTNVFNAGYHALFIILLDLGVVGAGIALSMAYWTGFILHLIYIIVSGIYKDTWTGLSRECLTEWKPFLCLAIPGMLMLCLEWWCYEILVFLCGLVGEIPLAAHTILYNITAFLYTVPMGLGIAVGIKVGNQLGAGNPEKAMTTSRVSVTMAWISAFIVVIPLLSLKDYIPKVFTDNLEISHLTSTILPLLAIFTFFDYSQATLSGVLRGAGHQKFGAVVNIIVFYAVTIPLSVPLIFYTRLQVTGAWWSMLTGVFLQTVAFIVRIALCNWNEESEKSQMRAGVKKELILMLFNSSGHEIPSNPTEGDTELTDLKMKNNKADHINYGLADSLSCSGDDKPSTQHSYAASVTSRVIVLLLFLGILIGGIVVRVYLDNRINHNNANCRLVNATNWNITELNDTNIEHFTTDRNKLNLTYNYELRNGINSTYFRYLVCNDKIMAYAPTTKFPVFNFTLFETHHIHRPRV